MIWSGFVENVSILIIETERIEVGLIRGRKENFLKNMCSIQENVGLIKARCFLEKWSLESIDNLMVFEFLFECDNGMLKLLSNRLLNP